MNKSVLWIFVLILIVPIVLALDTPSSLTPLNDTSWFTDPMPLGCSGSGAVNYSFYDNSSNHSWSDTFSSSNEEPLAPIQSIVTCNGCDTADTFVKEVGGYLKLSAQATAVNNQYSGSGAVVMENMFCPDYVKFVSGDPETSLSSGCSSTAPKSQIAVYWGGVKLLDECLYWSGNTCPDETSPKLESGTYELYRTGDIDDSTVAIYKDSVLVSTKTGIDCTLVVAATTRPIEGATLGSLAFIAYGQTCNYAVSRNFHAEWSINEIVLKKFSEGLLQDSTNTTYNWSRLWKGNTYNWSCGAYNVTSGISSDLTALQTFHALNFYKCSSGDDSEALNYTIQDEQNSTTMNGTLILNFNFGEFNFQSTQTNFDEFNYCLAPEGIETTLTSGIIEYSALDDTTYPFGRNYFYTDAGIIGGVVTDTSLYLLKGSTGTATSFTVLKDGLSLDTGVLRAKRYNTASGDYKLVAMSYISGGSTSMDLQHTDASYKFEVYEGATLICTVPDVTAGGLVISGATTLNCYTAAQSTNWWNQFVQLRDAGFTFNFNNITNVSSLIYSVPSGLASENCFRVNKWENMLSSQAYYQCSVSASGELTYIITDFDANYNMQFVTKFLDTNVYQVVGAEWISFKTYLYDKIGTDSVLYALLIILTLGMMGLSISPAASIGLSMAGVVVVWMFGILNLGIGAFIAILFVGGVLMSRLLK